MWFILGSTAFKKLLTILSLVCALGVVGAWVATGADMGWSKTQVQTMVTDPVTELEYPVWKNQLVFGVDFLALGLIGSAVLGGLAFFIPKKKPQPQNQP
jgi:F0F1-type ATP synthase assembly protein I